LFWRGLDWKIVQPEQWQRHCGDQLAQPVNPTPATNAKASRQSRLALRCPGLDPGPMQPKHKAIIQAPSRGLFLALLAITGWEADRRMRFVFRLVLVREPTICCEVQKADHQRGLI
jgi:hypothetical protein